MDRVLAERLVLAMIDHVADSSIPILLEGTDGRPKEAGSGTLFTVAGHYLVATAAHVVKHEPLSSIVLCPFKAPSRLSPKLIGHGWRGGERRDELDIAWIEIAPAAAAQMQRTFMPLAVLEGDFSYAADELIFVHGYPVERLKADDERREYLSSGIGYLTGTLAPARVESRFNPSLTADTFLTWPSDDNPFAPDGWLRRAPNAKGISGAGIWRMSNASGIWAPSTARMVAIEHSWVEGAWLRGTQVQHWLQMVAEDISDVAEECLRMHAPA